MKRPLPFLLPILCLGFLLPARAAGQDVELLGAVHGTPVPDGYWRQIAEDPASFRFRLEGRERLERIRQRPPGRDLGGREGFAPRVDAAASALQGDAAAGIIGPRDAPAVGAFRFPLVLGLFEDTSGAPYSRDDVQREFFEGPNSHFQTVTELYRDMSGGLLEVEGVVYDWVRTDLDPRDVTLNHSGLLSSNEKGVGAFIEAIVQALDDAGVDWSEFDQTGDGFVDILAVKHPLHGAECGGIDHFHRIWSHRWNLKSATAGRLDPGFETSTPRPDGKGYIHVNDYTVQPVLACDAEEINQIGVFAHELGHALGLPDLYPVPLGAHLHRGVGNWGLMGTGSWGCRGDDPARPCHMTAWSKAILGWLDVEEVEPGTDRIVRLEPVQSSNRVLKIAAQDHSREYLLLENRQRMGADVNLYEPGLLVWHVDDDVVSRRWDDNRVNSDASQMGVWLRQADGEDLLGAPRAHRGDPGDPFPGCIKPRLIDHEDPSIPCERNREFHVGRAPHALSHAGNPLGATLTEIDLVGTEPYDVQFRLTTRFTNVTLLAGEAQEPAGEDGFEVDGEGRLGGSITFQSAPFQTHELRAPSGVLQGEGVRSPFREWADGEERSRTLVTPFNDTTLVARYDGKEIEVRTAAESPQDGVSPGEIVLAPGERTGASHWFPEGASVTLEARARTGFAFREWVGAINGDTNPVTVTLDGPVDVRAAFDVVYGFAGPVEDVRVAAAVPLEVGFAVARGNDPVIWELEEGELPEGLYFLPGSGRIEGAAMETGTFPLEVVARDRIGLEVRALLQLTVTPPEVGADELVGPFLGTDRAPTELQKTYLDRKGNGNGSYDVGDLRAFLLANPELPRAVEETRLLRTLVPLGSFPDGEEAPRDDR